MRNMITFVALHPLRWAYVRIGSFKVVLQLRSSVDWTDLYSRYSLDVYELNIYIYIYVQSNSRNWNKPYLFLTVIRKNVGR